MNFNEIMAQFNFLVVFQGFFLAVALLVMSKGERVLNRILGVMLFTFAWSGLYYNIDSMGKMPEYLPIGYTVAISDFVYNPLIYFYVLFLTTKGMRITWRSALHFIPVLFMFVYYANYYFGSLDTKRELFERGYNYFPYDVMIFSFANLAQLLVYLILSAVILNRYGKQITNVYSDISKRNYNWLKFILIINTFSAIICFFIYGTQLDFVHRIIYVLGAILVYAIGYKMISQPPHLPDEELSVAQITAQQEQEAEEKPSPVKYERSGLTEDKAKLLAEKLQHHMLKERPYLEPELTLKQLAAQLSIPAHQLSQVINQQFGKNFYDYINSFRVEEVEKKLKSGQYNHLTLLAVALDCGFNSKASFNTVFKKIKSMSPSEYRKEIAGQMEEQAQIV